MRLPAYFLSVVALLLAQPSHAHLNPPDHLSEECTNFLRFELFDQPGLTYDWITVPEDWDHPDSSPKIHVFYYRWKKLQADGREDPIVFFNGGPSMSSHTSEETFQANPAAAELDLIYIDQRGTGCSDPYP